MAVPRSTPKDAQVMASILKDMGVVDYEPRVLNQMLEFTYRYVTSVLDDAQLYSTHAKKKSIDIDDVRLAINLQQEKNFTSPPARELTAEMARQRNSMPLPLIKSSAGLRLPPDRYSLTACNYRLKSAVKKTRTVHTVSRLSIPSLPTNTVNKGNPAFMNKLGAAFSVGTKVNTSTPSLVTRPASNSPKPVSTPIIKILDGNRLVPSVSSASVSVPATTTNCAPVSQILMPTVGVSSEMTTIKRKHEDDDYDME